MIFYYTFIIITFINLNFIIPQNPLMLKEFQIFRVLVSVCRFKKSEQNTTEVAHDYDNNDVRVMEW